MIGKAARTVSTFLVDWFGDQERSSEPRESYSPDVLVLSIPTARYNHSVGMIPDLLRLGGRLRDAFESTTASVYWIVSADLAHTHSAEGPYGYSEAAQVLDDAIDKWVQATDPNLRKMHLVEEAALVQDRGMSCGFTGLVLLQGAFDRDEELGFSWQGDLRANCHPTYYGMMVAKFTRGCEEADC